MKWLVLAVALAAASVAHAQPARIEPNELTGSLGNEPPEVILMTIGEGPRIFEKFGHAALCLHYVHGTQEPVCFNYGVTNFSAGSALVWDFLRGQQIFWVEPESWSAMLRFYKAEDRDIYAQTLPLPPDEAKAIEQQLLHDIDKAHRFYVYDHFFDNCTTRLRDAIDRATGGALHAHSTGAFPLTFREIGRRGLAEMPELLALADFVIGRQADDTPTMWQAMFHPAVLRAQVEATFGVAPRLLYHRHGPPFPHDGSSGRLGMLAIALVFTLPLLVAMWRRRLERVAIAWATLFLAGWGAVIWTLVVLSPIEGVRWNEVVLVLMPLDVVLPFLSPARRRDYARLRVLGLLLVSMLCAVGVMHQPLWLPILAAIMPLAIVAYELPHPLLRRRTSYAAADPARSASDSPG